MPRIRSRCEGVGRREDSGEVAAEVDRSPRAPRQTLHHEAGQLDGNEEPPNPESARLTALSEALDELAKAEPELAELVDLKYFCGFSFAEIAALRGIGERTAQRQWERARLYLHAALEPAP